MALPRCKRHHLRARVVKRERCGSVSQLLSRARLNEEGLTHDPIGLRCGGKLGGAADLADLHVAEAHLVKLLVAWPQFGKMSPERNAALHLAHHRRNTIVCVIDKSQAPQCVITLELANVVNECVDVDDSPPAGCPATPVP